MQAAEGKEKQGVPMTLAATVKHFLDDHHVSYRTLAHERTYSVLEVARILEIEPEQILQVRLMKDDLGMALAIFPLSHQIDLGKLSRTTPRSFQILSVKETDRFFYDCEPGSHPPFGNAYGCSLFLDSAMSDLEFVYFQTGSHTALIQMKSDDFQFLVGEATVCSFAVTSPENPAISAYSSDEMKFDCPPLSPIARQILEIAHHPTEDSAQFLSDLISNDPIVQSHILACAHQSGVDKESTSGVEAMQDVITKVLGFETVSHIALGITAGRSFTIPEEGPLGLQAFWRHALQSATLAKKIASDVLDPHRVSADLSYLIGFFHNFGFLLLGHLCPPEFQLLNRWLHQNPKTRVENLEKRLLGMGQAMEIVGNGHARLGAWLLHYWGMPEPIVVATRYHHCVDYTGKYQPYVALIQLTDQILKGMGLGDGENSLNSHWLESLGLSAVAIEGYREGLKVESQALDDMAMNLAN